MAEPSLQPRRGHFDPFCSVLCCSAGVLALDGHSVNSCWRMEGWKVGKRELNLLKASVSLKVEADQPIRVGKIPNQYKDVLQQEGAMGRP